MPFEPSKEIINKIKKNLPKKQTSKLVYRFLDVGYILSLFLSFVLAFISFKWLIDQAKVFFVFWPFITSSVSGWIWVVIPEFLIFGGLFLSIIYFIYKRTDWKGVGWADVVVGWMLVVIVSAASILPASAASDLTVVKNTHDTLVTLPYRIWLRDKHIDDLENKKEYYGTVDSVTNNQVNINHGGVILPFKNENISGLKVGQRIWIKFKLEQNTRAVTEQKLFD
jgi:hypothetical protein